MKHDLLKVPISASNRDIYIVNDIDVAGPVADLPVPDAGDS
jgi:hypothetical protein